MKRPAAHIVFGNVETESLINANSSVSIAVTGSNLEGVILKASTLCAATKGFGGFTGIAPYLVQFLIGCAGNCCQIG